MVQNYRSRQTIVIVENKVARCHASNALMNVVAFFHITITRSFLGQHVRDMLYVKVVMSCQMCKTFMSLAMLMNGLELMSTPWTTNSDLVLLYALSSISHFLFYIYFCLLYTSDAADE